MDSLAIVFGIFLAIFQMIIIDQANAHNIKKKLSKTYLTPIRRGVLLPGAPNPVHLINKLIKQQVQIYYLHL